MAQWIRICQCREREFNPWSWTIPHATERPSPWATVAELSSGTGEPQWLSPCAAPAETHTPRASALQREAHAARSPRSKEPTQRGATQETKVSPGPPQPERA